MKAVVALGVGLALVGLALVGCDREGDGPASAGKVVEPTPAAAATSVKALLGEPGNPSGELARLMPGMTTDAAKAAAPDLMASFEPKLGSFSTAVVGLDGVRQIGYFSRDPQRLTRVAIELPPTLQGEVAATWGAGKVATDPVLGPRTMWHDPATGWRAGLKKGFAEDYQLEFTRYLPAAALLGDGPDLAFTAGKPIVGATIADLRARYGAQLIEKDQAQADADRAALNQMMGKSVDGALGKAAPSAHIELPPTEWGSFWTRVHLIWKGDRVDWFTTSIDYEEHPSAKDDLMALFEKKWGKPKQVSKYGKTQLVFRDAAPRVVVEDDTISHHWDIQVSAGRPGARTKK